MVAKVKDVDRGYRKLMRQALAVDALVCTVGVQGAKAAEDHGGLSNVDLATIHEFGAKDEDGDEIVSERSFLRSTVDGNNGYQGEIKKLGVHVLAGKLTPTHALAVLGEKVVSDINSAIEAGIDPPLAESTVARKGSSLPLVDTAQMKNAITYEVRKASEVK